MSTITLMQQQKHNASRVSIFLDGEFAFSVTLDVALQLSKGQELTQPEIDALRNQDQVDRAYAAAIHYLGPRPRSQAEVERHLREKKHEAEAIVAAIAQLIEQQYLDDTEFARFWTENRVRFRPKSAAALRYELAQKGVDREVAQEAVAGIDEDAAAWDAVAPKLERWRDLEDPEFERKISAFLARRGFNYDIVRRTVRRARAEFQS